MAHNPKSWETEAAERARLAEQAERSGDPVLAALAARPVISSHHRVGDVVVLDRSGDEHGVLAGRVLAVITGDPVGHPGRNEHGKKLFDRHQMLTPLASTMPSLVAYAQDGSDMLVSQSELRRSRVVSPQELATMLLG